MKHPVFRILGSSHLGAAAARKCAERETRVEMWYKGRPWVRLKQSLDYFGSDKHSVEFVNYGQAFPLEAMLRNQP